MIEVKMGGGWPETAIADVHAAWEKLGGLELKDSKVILIGPESITRSLDAIYGMTTWTYASIIKQNLGIDRVIHLRQEGNYVLLYSYEINADNYPELALDGKAVKIQS